MGSCSSLGKLPNLMKWVVMLKLPKIQPVARQRRLPPTDGAAKEAEGMNLPRLAVVTDVGELCELIQSSLLSKRISILDAAFLSSQASLSPKKDITESPLSISSDDRSNIASVKRIVGGLYRISLAEEDLAEIIAHHRDARERFGIRGLTVHPQPSRNGDTACPNKVLLLRKAGEDIVPDDSFLFEQFVLVNISIVPTHADDVEKNVSRANPTDSSVFKGVTNVNNSSPIPPLTDLDSDDDASLIAAET
ncbi:hypothetical protein F0562_017587 [Nyssa sinensis]|uniref:Uncharacterized protein n=1 Tax=Nyssa sinensis TaxID=561372 RepID=A0A5J4ZHD1_9ASTE|nr:hypothetical protein F0562_017587 [Nyssa sinensis]